MSEGDIIRLNRKYKCEDKRLADKKVDIIQESKKENILNENENSHIPETINEEVKLKDDFNDVDDMILNREQMDELYAPNAAKRNGLKTAFHRWPNAVVAYEFDNKFGNVLSNFY